MDTKHFLVAALICGAVWAQSEPSVSEVLDELPPELQGKVNATDIEAAKNKTQALFKEKCEKNGAVDAYNKALKASEEFPQCVKKSLGLEDISQLKKEIEAAKPNGTVDEVFKKKCQNAPQAKQCFKDMLEAVKPCFTEEERKNLNTVSNITEQLAEFICFKDGDRIALFIAEGGPECFQDKQEKIQDCVHSTYGDEYNFDANNISTSAIPEINFGEKECKQLSVLQECVVSALESCAAPTSANIVESLFKFARQATPCKTLGVSEAKPRSQVAANDKPNSAVSVTISTAAVLFAVASALY